MTDELNFDHPFFGMPINTFSETEVFQIVFEGNKSTPLKGIKTPQEITEIVNKLLETIHLSMNLCRDTGHSCSGSEIFQDSLIHSLENHLQYLLLRDYEVHFKMKLGYSPISFYKDESKCFKQPTLKLIMLHQLINIDSITIR